MAGHEELDVKIAFGDFNHSFEIPEELAIKAFGTEPGKELARRLKASLRDAINRGGPTDFVYEKFVQESGDPID